MGKHFALTLQLEGLQTKNSSRNSGAARAGAVAPRGAAKSGFFSGGIKYGSILFFGCCALAAMYLYQVNSFSTQGFAITTLQSKISDLQEQQRQLQVQSADLQSLQRIQAQPDISSMVPVTSVSYLPDPGSAPSGSALTEAN